MTKQISFGEMGAMFFAVDHKATRRRASSATVAIEVVAPVLTQEAIDERVSGIMERDPAYQAMEAARTSDSVSDDEFWALECAWQSSVNGVDFEALARAELMAA